MSTLTAKHAPGRAAVCTIVSKNYLPYARVLARPAFQRELDRLMTANRALVA